jgi:L-gulono-1,4-lactone dehydrogenase
MSILATSVGGREPGGPPRLSWRNWAGNQQASPIAIHRPQTEEEIASVVQHAAERGERVKAFGSGHSFTAIAVSDSHLLDLSDYGRVLDVDQERGLVTVQAGIKLSKLCEELHAQGLAMEDMGDVAYQSIAGATSTGTHGTGASFGCIPTQIRAMRLVVGDGSVIQCSADENPEVFTAARVGIGALGIVSTITLQCSPAFNLHALEQAIPLDDVMGDLDSYIDGNEHFEFFWQPGAHNAFTKQNNRTSTPEQPLSKWRNFRDDILIGDVAANALVKLDRFSSPASRWLRRRLPVTGREDYVDRSYRVFTSERRVKFVEMEYFIPRAAARDAMRSYRQYLRDTGSEPSMAIEMRFTAADDIPLSMSSGRETCSFAIHVRAHEGFQQYFEGVETLMRQFDGRPHWGKLHFQTRETLQPLYPMWDDFQQIRTRLDPEGRFANTYLDRVLGSVSG